MSNLLCKYKNIFGAEKTGIHKYRIFNIAIFDLIGTIVIAFIFYKIFNINFFIILIILLFLAIIIHRLFCVNTTINKLIFGVI
jgi:uncharacterized membrane protein YcaP (DUF421 family)